MDVEDTSITGRKSRLERIKERIAKLEKQKRAMEVAENMKKRKARTRRLIQIGAIAVKYLDCENDIEPVDFERRVKDLLDNKAK